MKASIVVSEANAVFVYDKRALRKLMRQVGNEVAAKARSLIKAAGKKRPRKGQPRSQPGGPPASLTGKLASSIKVYPFRDGDGVAVRDTQFYAVMLEAGAQGGVSAHGQRNAYRRVAGKYVRTAVNGRRVLLPRPFLSLALQAKEDSLSQRVRAAIVDGVAFRRQR